MKRKWLAWLALVLALLIVGVSWNEIALTYALGQDYPEFLKEFPAEALDRRIEGFAGKDLVEEDLDQLWKLLWIKKDYYRNFYITEGVRKELVKGVSLADANGLQGTYLKLNLLKYKLGVNDLEELRVFGQANGFGDNLAEAVEGQVCGKLEGLRQEVDWDDSCSVSHFIEAKFFCGIGLAQEDVDAAERVISQGLGNCVAHCSEHCFEDVPVYVNGCEMAGNENEEYHCLFFIGG